MKSLLYSFGILFLILVTACTTYKEVIKEKTIFKTDTVTVTKVHTDTIFRVRYVDRIIEKIIKDTITIRDTLTIVKHDTIIKVDTIILRKIKIDSMDCVNLLRSNDSLILINQELHSNLEKCNKKSDLLITFLVLALFLGVALSFFLWKYIKTFFN